MKELNKAIFILLILAFSSCDAVHKDCVSREEFSRLQQDIDAIVKNQKLISESQLRLTATLSTTTEIQGLTVDRLNLLLNTVEKMLRPAIITGDRNKIELTQEF